ncbi:CatB-related O-acetyltransferase [Aquimarina sp. I32.4]|uniref:CatB-related O-acetyltransferase n=1 Tax=Aquimarina sp. I32.4 TaxID=2053903 RepID=UPI0013049472|nr:CatB-related O-acetyltransferase [Aquimarina sp. I32.4]
MLYRIRIFLWKILGIEYHHALKIHEYVFLKNDSFSTIGHKTYDNGALVWRWTEAELKIGKYCSIANNVRFIVDEGYHQASKVTSFPLVNNLFKEELLLPNGKNKSDFLKEVKQREGITIGNDVWIGMGSYIMPGAKIGNGVTIASNSVVVGNSDIPDYCVIGGSPAKIIKFKHEKQTIEKLNRIAWWNWDEEVIKKRVEDFYMTMDDFIKKYDN